MAKVRAKTEFTKARRQLLMTLSESGAQREDIAQSSKDLEEAISRVLDALTGLCEMYYARDDSKNVEKIGEDIEAIERQYTAAEDQASDRLIQFASAPLVEEQAASSKNVRRGHGLRSDDNQSGNQSEEDSSSSEEKVVEVTVGDDIEHCSVEDAQEGEAAFSGKEGVTLVAGVSLQGKDDDSVASAANQHGRSRPRELGRDLWKQLKRVEISRFSRDKKR